MFYSELLRQRVLGGKWLLEMGEETRGGNQDVNLHLEGRGVIPAGADGWEQQRSFRWDLLGFRGGCSFLKIPTFLLFFKFKLKCFLI